MRRRAYLQAMDKAQPPRASQELQQLEAPIDGISATQHADAVVEQFLRALDSRRTDAWPAPGGGEP